jgi:hypothetical protein
MDHAEVRERLADALLSPRDGGLEAAIADASGAGEALRAHIASCPSCARELDALRATGALLAAAAPDALTASAAVRERVMATARGAGVQLEVAPRRPRPFVLPRGLRVPPAAVAMAAVVVLVAGLVGGLALVDQRQEADRQLAELTALAASTQEILADPASVRIDLAGPGGSGSVLIGPSSGKLVAVSSTLPAPPAGRRYDCFVERGGIRTWIGWMHWSGDLAYWAGTVAGVSPPWQPGDAFVVTEDGDPAPALSGS